MHIELASTDARMHVFEYVFEYAIQTIRIQTVRLYSLHMKGVGNFPTGLFSMHRQGLRTTYQHVRMKKAR